MFNLDGARYKRYYFDVGIKKMREEYGYENIMQVPRLTKVIVSSSIEEPGDTKALERVADDLMLITGQKAVPTVASKSIAAFKLRSGVVMGCKVTLRGRMMYDFIDRLVNIALPRVRDFMGFSSTQFDGNGNFSFGLKEQLVFPEIIYDKIDKIRGMNIVVVTTAKTDKEACSLLKVFNFPFYK